MGRIRKLSPSSIHPDPTLSEILWLTISKHRSCWLHIAAFNHHHERKITPREVEEIKKKFKKTCPCFSRTFPRSTKRMMRRGASTDGKIYELDNSTRLQTFPCGDSKYMSRHVKSDKLDTSTFELYMESLWRSFTEDKKMSFDHLDSLWFSLYRDASNKPKVLKWIKQKGIFSKKYVFVPIVCWSHWSLLIFVHFGENLKSENGRPCMLLLDSLKAADPRRLEPEIRKFVADIYKVEGRAENEKEISQIPLLVPKVPQQRNAVECGNYVLYFINLFMESAPEKFSITEGYPYFMKQDWFDSESFEYFCKKLEKKLRKTNTSSGNLGKVTKRNGGANMTR